MNSPPDPDQAPEPRSIADARAAVDQVKAAPYLSSHAHVIHPDEAARAARGEVVATFCAACFQPVILNAPGER